MYTKASIIIPNLHSPVIGQVIEAVLAQGEVLSNLLDIWVVGQDRYGQVRTSGRVHMLETPQPVPPALARNKGAAATTGDALIFLDADCIPQPGWLAKLLEAAKRWPDAGAISGAMLPDGDTFAMHCGQVATFHEHLNLNPPGQRQTLASFSLLVPRSAWSKVGGFDEKFMFAAGEDLDLSIRIHRQGYPLYFEPQAEVRHRPGRANWRALWRHAFRGGGQAIAVRRQYADYYRLPNWVFDYWTLVLGGPFIALARTLQIYATPHIRRFWRCAPWVVLSKLAWCWGAAAETKRSPTSPLPPRDSQGDPTIGEEGGRVE